MNVFRRITNHRSGRAPAADAAEFHTLDVTMNVWRRLLGLLWLLVAGAFMWAVIDLGNVIGGLRWLDHVGASAATAVYAAAAILALLVAVKLLRNGNVVVIAAVAVGLLGFAIVSTLVLPIPGLRLLRPPRLTFAWIIAPVLWLPVVAATLVMKEKLLKVPERTAGV